MKLILTVDTEADNQWDAEVELTTDNLGHVPRFQALCDRFEFPPTYLCTHEVVTSAAFNKDAASARPRGPRRDRRTPAPLVHAAVRQDLGRGRTGAYLSVRAARGAA